MEAIRHLGFSKVCIFMADRVEGSKCVIMPKCVAIGQSVAEIWLFFDFQDDGRYHVGFLNV